MRSVVGVSGARRPTSLALARVGGAFGVVGFLLLGAATAAPERIPPIARVAAWLAMAAFWLGLYALLRERRPLLALLGAASGVASSAIEIAVALGAPSFGGLLTVLRVPRVGCMSLALLDGAAPRRALAWWGLLIAGLTVAELALWITRGSPNDPLPVGGVAASLGVLWKIAVAIWLLAGAGLPRAGAGVRSV